MTTPAPRRGFTVFEIVVVLALLLLLAAVLLPSVGAFRGDTRQRAAADLIRAELAVARSRAMEEGRPYRVAVSADGKRVRRAPDGPEFATAAGFGHADSSAQVVDYPFDEVTAEVVSEQPDSGPVQIDNWVTIATVQPDGTCREDGALVLIKEEDGSTMRVHVRGLTGASRVVKGGTK